MSEKVILKINTGVSLIALLITVIILVILTAVSLRIAFGTEMLEVGIDGARKLCGKSKARKKYIK